MTPPPRPPWYHFRPTEAAVLLAFELAVAGIFLAAYYRRELAAIPEPGRAVAVERFDLETLIPTPSPQELP